MPAKPINCEGCGDPTVALSYRDKTHKWHRAANVRWCRAEERVLDSNGRLGGHT